MPPQATNCDLLGLTHIVAGSHQSDKPPYQERRILAHGGKDKVIGIGNEQNQSQKKAGRTETGPTPWRGSGCFQDFNQGHRQNPGGKEATDRIQDQLAEPDPRAAASPACSPIKSAVGTGWLGPRNNFAARALSEQPVPAMGASGVRGRFCLRGMTTPADNYVRFLQFSSHTYLLSFRTLQTNFHDTIF